VSAASDGYLLDNADALAGLRLRALGELFDATTFRHSEKVGLGPGARCWEVGAGGDSVVRGFAERAGPSGYVLATDIDTSWARDARAPNVEVRVHDVATDPPPGGDFDLVHARLVLVHLRDRAAALRTMIAALRPGGKLLIEDADPALQPLACIDPAGPDETLANEIRAAFRVLLAERGADLAYGRTLPRALRAAGLHDVGVDAYFPVALPACAPLEAATVTMLRASIVAKGLATDAQIDRHLANVAAGKLDLATPPLISAWGTRPASWRLLQERPEDQDALWPRTM
jgi:SAM-dependent methyltransferase